MGSIIGHKVNNTIFGIATKGYVDDAISGIASTAYNYVSTWDATTNTPALASGAGTKGDVYYVNVGGSTNLDGITDWVAGDSAAFNGSVWTKWDHTDQITSIFGRQGIIEAVSGDYDAAEISSLPDTLNYWSKMGSTIEITNPVVGPVTTLDATVVYETGKFDNGVRGTVADEEKPISFPTISPSFDFAQGCIEMWIRPVGYNIVNGINDAGDGEGKYLWQWMSPAPHNYVHYFKFGVIGIGWQTNSAAGQTHWDDELPGLDIADGELAHIALVWDRTHLTKKRRVYLNGIEVGSNNDQWSDEDMTGATMTIGSATGGTRILEGQMDNMKWWDFAQTDFSGKDIEGFATVANHLASSELHREINDSEYADTDLWSADQISGHVATEIGSISDAEDSVSGVLLGDGTGAYSEADAGDLPVTIQGSPPSTLNYWSKMGTPGEITSPEVGPTTTLTATVAYETGKFDNGARTTVVDEAKDISFPTVSPSFDHAQGCIEMWIRPVGFNIVNGAYDAGGPPKFLWYWNSAYEQHFRFQGSGGGIYWNLNDAGGSYAWSGELPGLDIADGELAHIAFVWDRTHSTKKRRIYLNGVEVGSDNTAWVDEDMTAGTMYIGTDTGGYTGFYGQMDNMKWWDFAQTDFSSRDTEGFSSIGDAQTYLDDNTAGITANVASIATNAAYIDTVSGDVNTHSADSDKHSQVYSFFIPGDAVSGTAIQEAEVAFSGDISLVRATAKGPVGGNLDIDIDLNDTTIFTDQDKRPQIISGSLSDISDTPDIITVVPGDILGVNVDAVDPVDPGNKVKIAIVVV